MSISLNKETNDKFAVLDKKIDDKFISLNKETNDKFAALDKKIDDKFNILDTKIDQINQNIMNFLIS